MSALTINKLCKAFGGLRVTTDVNLNVEPGERRLIIGPNGEFVGRQVMRILDEGGRVAGFVGDVDVDVDRHALDEFVRDVIRDDA